MKIPINFTEYYSYVKVFLGTFAITDKFSCPKTFLGATRSNLSFLLLTHRIAVMILLI